MQLTAQDIAYLARCWTPLLAVFDDLLRAFYPPQPAAELSGLLRRVLDISPANPDRDHVLESVRADFDRAAAAAPTPTDSRDRQRLSLGLLGEAMLAFCVRAQPQRRADFLTLRAAWRRRLAAENLADTSGSEEDCGS